MKFCPFHVTGAPVMKPWSLPKAMLLPVNVSEPRNTSRPSAPVSKRETCPCVFKNSAMPTSAVAAPPNAWLKAIRSGIFVIGIERRDRSTEARAEDHPGDDPLVGDDLRLEQRRHDGDEHAELAEVDPALGLLGRRQPAEA